MKSRLRIAFWHDLLPGGALRAVAGQATALAARGHAVRIWTPQSAGAPAPAGWFDGPVITEVVPVEPTRTRGGLAGRLRGDAGAYLDRVAADDANGARAFNSMRQWSADVLLTHSSWWSFVPPFEAPRDLRSLLYLHEPNRSLYEAGDRNPWALPPDVPETAVWRRPLTAARDYRRLQAMRLRVRNEWRWVHSYSRILVNSMYSRESVLKAYGCDSTVSPLGVGNPTLLQAPARPKVPTVVTLGDLSPHKGAILAIDAIAAISSASRPTFRWFGNRASPGFLEVVQRRARERAVDFQFCQGLDDTTLATQLSEACCFLYCSHLEPFGLSPLEANLAGTAVVAVAEGGVREIVIDGVNGMLVSERDPAALARHISLLLGDLSAAGDLGRSARAHVLKMHSWERAVEPLESLLGERA